MAFLKNTRAKALRLPRPGGAARAAVFLGGLGILSVGAATSCRAEDKEDGGRKPMQPAPSAWTKPAPITAEFEGASSGAPIAVVGNVPGAAHVLAVAQADGPRSRIVVIEDKDGRWTEVLSVPEPGFPLFDPPLRLFKSPDGKVVLAWGADESTPGGRWALRDVSGTWSAVRRINEECVGDVAVGIHGGSLAVAFVRGVVKTDLSRLLGDFVHDPVRQAYEKPAVATLQRGEWVERFFLEGKSFSRSRHLSLAGRYLAYFREAKGGREELVCADLSRRDVPPEVVMGAEEKGTFTVARLVGPGPETLLAYVGKDGILIRRRVEGGWSKPETAIKGDFFTFAIARTPGGVIHLCAIECVNFRVWHRSGRGGKWRNPERLGVGLTCALTIHGEKAHVFWTERRRKLSNLVSRQRVVTTRSWK